MKKRTGILLRLIDSRESDYYLTFLERECGLIEAYARGARKSRKRFAGRLEPFREYEYELGRRERLLWMEPTDHVTTSRSPDYLLVFSLHNYLAELLIRFKISETMAPQLYDPVKQFFSLHVDPPPQDVTLAAFCELLIGFLDVGGFLPDLERCSGCLCKREPDVPLTLTFSSGALCGRCDRSSGGEQTMDLNRLEGHLVAGLMPPEPLHFFLEYLGRIIHTPIKSRSMLEGLL